jgi:nitrogen fixation-related uncharacterized protein
MVASWDIVIATLIVAGILFFLTAVFALYWAAKNGQFEQFESGSKVIFDAEEPEGKVMDRFPVRKKKARTSDKTGI